MLRSFLRGRIRVLPWWARLALGVVAVAVGAALTGKPFASLDALVWLVAACLLLVGGGELARAAEAPSPRLAMAGGAVWVAAGIVVLAWRGITVDGLAVVCGLVLLAGGAVRLASGLRGDVDERWITGISGAARIVAGALALAWPDITVLVLALLVGPATILFGLGEIAAALRVRLGRDGRARTWPRAVRFLGATASLLAVLALLAVSAAVHRATAGPDGFYDTPSALPGKPGVLLRSEAWQRGLPAGARGWRILYTTTRQDGSLGVASGVVVAPRAPGAAPQPVIAWAHGTTGFARKCAPSVLRAGLPAGALPALADVVARGWALVATDYVGLGAGTDHPYLIGEPEARSVLDAVRAARTLPDLSLEPRTVVWGHSQGGGAALWTGILAPTYAPDAGVIGVAALAPATELPALFDRLQGTPVGKIMGSYMLSAYAAAYPDVRSDDYVRPAARTIERETAGRCLSGPEALVSVAAAVDEEPVFRASLASGALGARLAENVPARPIQAPLLVAQGLADALVLPSVQDGFVQRLCDAGQRLEYRSYRGLDHVGLVLAPATPLVPDLLRWTQDRLDGREQPAGCQRSTT